MMERLTFLNGDGIPCVRDDQCCEEQSEHYCGPAIDRLAAYEDTGLMPEEVLPKEKADEIALNLMRLADLEEFAPYDRIRELAEADKTGRVVVLPCKVGETVWYEEYGIENGEPVKYGIQPHVVLTHHEYMVTEGKQRNGWMPLGGLGINWFLTREEAEEAKKKFDEEWGKRMEAGMGEIHCPVGQKGDIGHAGPTEAE